jgi:hypothetical protein
MERRKESFSEVERFPPPNLRAMHREVATATLGAAPVEPTRTTAVEFFPFEPSVRRQATTPAPAVAPQALGWAWGPAAPGPEAGEGPGEPDGDAA